MTKNHKLRCLPPVGWFNVVVMVSSGIKALISKTIGARNTRREVLAALDIAQGSRPLRASLEAYKKDQPLWLDYAADLGDGFNGTFSIAWLMGRDYIFLDEIGAAVSQPIAADALSEIQPSDRQIRDKHALPAGHMTIFGGDQVYPFATAHGYEDRLKSPLNAARPWDERFGGRALYVLPGNHDWYDGLTSFARNFCQPKRWIGAWQVQQRRSYFSVPLGHGFWVWGIDLATDDDFDAPQLDYFKEQNDIKPNDQIVLCISTPDWIKHPLDTPENTQDRNSWDIWSKVELIEAIVKKKQARIAVFLAGDQHHYSHYQTTDNDKNEQHFITCGGGGAYLAGTNALPKQVSLGKLNGATLKFAFPSAPESTAMKSGVFKLVVNHKVFCVALYSALLVALWFLQSASLKLIGPLMNEQSLIGVATQVISGQAAIIEFLRVFLSIIVHRPSMAFLVAVLAAMFWLYARSGAAPRTHFTIAIGFGILHFLVQMLVVIFFAALVGAKLAILTLTFGWLVCGVVFSTYLWVSNRLVKAHELEMFSSQSIQDWKCFLRMRVDETGLAIYPIGLKTAAKSWKRAKLPGVKNTAKANIFHRIKTKFRGETLFFDYPDGTTHLLDPEQGLAPHLIEQVITIPVGKGAIK